MVPIIQTRASDFRRRTFNMVEISIALLVLGVGLISILGVFPIAANANREAVGMNYGSNACEELLNFVASRGKDNWTVVSGLQDDLADISSTSTNISDWTQYLDTGDGNSGVWGLTSDATGSIYRVITDTTISGSATTTAFDGIARVWRSGTTGYYYDATATPNWQTRDDTTAERGAQLNVEISWPATIPYSARKKAYYSLEVSRND